MGKQQASPLAIVIAIVVLLVVIFVIYKLTLGKPKAPVAGQGNMMMNMMPGMGGGMPGMPVPGGGAGPPAGGGQ